MYNGRFCAVAGGMERFILGVWKELHMAPLTRAQMKQLAEDALRAVQEWLTAIPREILKKLSPDSLFYVLRPNPLWPLRRFTIGKLGQTNKANLEILNERRRNIISRFETLVGKTNEQVRQDRWEKAVQNRNTLIQFQLGEGRYPSWRAGAAGPDGWGPSRLLGRGGWGSSSSSSD